MPKRAVPLNRYFPAILVALLGLALSVLAQLIFTGMARRDFDAVLAQQAQQYSAAISEDLLRNIETIQAVDSFLTVTDRLSRDRFSSFVHQTEGSISMLFAVEWAPVVKDADRKAVEAQARLEGIDDFTIRDLAPDGRFVPAPSQPDYVPVLFGEPWTTARNRLGFNLMSDAKRREALERARDGNRKIATGRVRLLHDRADQADYGILVFSPVYRTGATDTIAERRANISGYAVGVFRPADIIRSAVRDLSPMPLDLYLYDRSAAPDERFLHFRPASQAKKPTTPLPERELYEGTHWATTLSVAGRQWTLVLTPNRSIGGPSKFYAWTAFAVGLTLTGLMIAYLLAALRHDLRQQRLSAELRDSNALLESEIAERRRVSEHLRDRTYHLGERMREIDCLYALSKLFTERGVDWREVCGRAVDLLSASFPLPDAICARVLLNGEDFRTRNWCDGDLRISHPITVMGEVVGRVELGYLGEAGSEGARSFIADEHNLVADATERLANYAERLHSEEAVLAAKAEAEQANSAKSRFFAAASHDLRQPLQAMHLFLHILRQRLTDPKDADIANKLFEAMQTTDGLLDALLQVAKLDAGTVRPELADFPISDLFDKLSNEYSLLAGRKGLSLRCVGSKAVVRSDPVLLGRILGNLVNNAIRYTDRGRILVGARRRGAWLEIQVVDTGRGIPGDQLQAVFQEFYQIGNSERDRAQGLGLGLAIVERMARLLDHDISVRSQPDKGSAFSVLVPLAAAPAAATEPLPAPGDVIQGGPLVMVIENEVSQLEGLHMLLEQWGCRVVACQSALQAIRHAQGMPTAPALVLTDFRLPGDLTGIDVAKRIAAAAGKPVAAIILTGDTDPHWLQQARQSGYHLLHKPVDPVKLQSLIAGLTQPRHRQRLAAP